MTEEIADPLQHSNSFPFVFSQLGNGNNLSRKQRLPTELGELFARPLCSLLYPRFLLFGATYPKKAGLIRLLIICFWFYLYLFIRASQPMRTK